MECYAAVTDIPQVSVTKNNTGLFLAYTTYPLVEGSNSGNLDCETQPGGGFSMWNFTGHSNGMYRMESHTSVLQYVRKNDIHHFCSILLTRASLIAKLNFKETGNYDYPEYQKQKLDISK